MSLSYNLTPVASLLLLGALLALGPLIWVAWRHRHQPTARLQALTALTLFLTFDLVLFGAFTRLSDSGLGCPDWPGCYGSVTPLGAQLHINEAQAALPSGPVTHGKAWVEMIHRYLATSVGGLILALAGLTWHAAVKHRLPVSPWWATATLLWVCVQGAFGALTVTLKLYPAIVTAHLLGGLMLLVLLTVQKELYGRRPLNPDLTLPRPLKTAAWALAALLTLQIALGGWVSTNYAVLACTDFPACQNAWWPSMDFTRGYTLLRPLGLGPDGSALPFAALTAIHYMHRLSAYVVFAAMAWFAWRLWAAHFKPWAYAIGALCLWQLASGLSNVLLGWPLIGAVAHTAGAAAWVVVLAALITRYDVAEALSD
jgi:heme a synthase